MGWFSNTNSTARQFNNTALLSLLANIDHKAQTLGNCHTQTTETIQALEIASLLTQQSSALGQKLAQRLTSLKAHSTEQQEQIKDSLVAFAVTNLMIEQYQLPRIKRTIDMSGDEMAGLALAGNLKIQVELPVIHEKHNGQIDEANLMLNEVVTHSKTRNPNGH